MKVAYAGGGDDWPPQQQMIEETINVEYTWQDRLIDWVKTDTIEAMACLIILVACVLLIKKALKHKK